MCVYEEADTRRLALVADGTPFSDHAQRVVHAGLENLAGRLRELRSMFDGFRRRFFFSP